MTTYAIGSILLSSELLEMNGNVLNCIFFSYSFLRNIVGGFLFELLMWLSLFDLFSNFMFCAAKSFESRGRMSA